jgi:hypothetical protein
MSIRAGKWTRLFDVFGEDLHNPAVKTYMFDVLLAYHKILEDQDLYRLTHNLTHSFPEPRTPFNGSEFSFSFMGEGDMDVPFFYPVREPVGAESLVLPHDYLIEKTIDYMRKSGVDESTAKRLFSRKLPEPSSMFNPALFSVGNIPQSDLKKASSKSDATEFIYRYRL